MISFSAAYVFHSSPILSVVLKEQKQFGLTHFAFFSSPMRTAWTSKRIFTFVEQTRTSVKASSHYAALMKMFICYFGKLKWYTSFYVDFSQLYISERRCFSHSLSSRGGRRTSYWFLQVASRIPQHFLTTKRKSNVEHKNSTDKLAARRSSFFDIYSCLHSILLLTSFSKHVSLLLGKKHCLR